MVLGICYWGGTVEQKRQSPWFSDTRYSVQRCEVMYKRKANGRPQVRGLGEGGGTDIVADPVLQIEASAALLMANHSFAA